MQPIHTENFAKVEWKKKTKYEPMLRFDLFFMEKQNVRLEDRWK